MRTQLAIANPQETDAQRDADVRDDHRGADAAGGGRPGAFAPDGGPEHRAGARRRLVLDAPRVGSGAGARSLISFDAQGSAASLETAVDQPAATWYFAEGSTVDPQELFYLVQNPGATEALVRVRYLLPNGAAPVVRTYAVAPGSRATIWVDRENPALASTDVAAEITSVDGTPIVVERSIYLRQEDWRRRAAATAAPASRLPLPGGSSKARPVSTGRGCSSPTRDVKPPRCARRISGRTAAA